MSDLDPLAAFSLAGRTAVVTGASSGLGARFVEVLAGSGARVVVFARRLERLEQLAARVPGVIPVAGDVAVGADLERLVAVAVEDTGRLDVLVNNAGVGDVSAAEDEPMELFRRSVEINLTAVFALSQLAGRHMLAAGGGTIVNVASVLGTVGTGQIPQAGYAATKAGVINLSRELAAQWARRGVRVNALCPGWFPSEMTAEMFADESAMRWMRRKVPMGRAGAESELDGALLLLASDAGAYITGQTLVVDGGYGAV